jgi:hypothetical protein
VLPLFELQLKGTDGGGLARADPLGARRLHLEACARRGDGAAKQARSLLAAMRAAGVTRSVAT